MSFKSADNYRANGKVWNIVCGKFSCNPADALWQTAFVFWFGLICCDALALRLSLLADLGVGRSPWFWSPHPCPSLLRSLSCAVFFFFFFLSRRVSVTVSAELSEDFNIFESKTFEPRHEKMCLREFPTRSDSNWPAQLQKLAWGLEIWI